jgi:hypothetical protein
MRLISSSVLQILAMMAATNCCNIASADETVIFTDSFDDVKGHVIGQIDGKIQVAGEAATRRILPFMGTSPLADGKLIIAALEDPVTPGFDDKPGVLAISFKSVPTAATYCGFVYLGGVTPDRALKLKEITEAPSVESLKRIKLSFRFKATNTLESADVGAIYSFRLEPLVDNSYASRLSFGSIEATDKWQTFESTLDRGQNIENFLKTVQEQRPSLYKLIWAQAGSITNYQPGDTVLVDDIEFTATDR